METVPALKLQLIPALYKIAAGMPLSGALAQKPRQPMPAKPAMPAPAKPAPVKKPAAKAGSPVTGGLVPKSAAYRIGHAQKCMLKLAELLPAEDMVEKVAKRTKIPVEVIKLACLRKQAVAPAGVAGGAASAAGKGVSRFMPKSPLGLLLGAAAIPLLGIPAARGAANYVNRGLSGYGWGGGGGLLKAPHMGTIGGFDPKTTSELQKMIAMESMRNAQLSSLLQGIRGAYQPAGNPWGYQTAPRPMM